MTGCRSDADTGGSPEHVFDTMVVELEQLLEKVRRGSHCVRDYRTGGVGGGAYWEEVLCYSLWLSLRGGGE